MKFRFFLTNLIFFRFNEIVSWGKKHTALFQTHNWEKSSFFSTLIRVFARLYANMWQGGHNVPSPPGPNRVNSNISFIRLVWLHNGVQYNKRTLISISLKMFYIFVFGEWWVCSKIVSWKHMSMNMLQFEKTFGNSMWRKNMKINENMESWRIQFWSENGRTKFIWPKTNWYSSRLISIFNSYFPPLSFDFSTACRISSFSPIFFLRTELTSTQHILEGNDLNHDIWQISLNIRFFGDLP